MEESFDPWAYLSSIAEMDDAQIDPALGALALAALEHEGVSLGRYTHHIKTLQNDVEEKYQKKLAMGESDSLSLKHQVLCTVLAEEYGYIGDSASYDDIQNASVIKAIDRAKGLPITLSILYISAARAQGWSIAGLNFPGHFLCRLEEGGERIIFDPFQGGLALGAPELRTILKQMMGDEAELSSSYYEACSNRDILIRLENNIKHRKIDMEDYAGALTHIERMRMIDPDEYRLLLDAGVLYAKTDQALAAIESLQSYIEIAPYNRDRQEAELLLRELQRGLN